MSNKEQPDNPSVEEADIDGELEAVAPTGEKIQKVLARVGLGSRRELEREISEGKVKVNGQVATLGDRVLLSDTVEFRGKKVRLEDPQESLRVVLYNKPEGEICTRSDPEGRKSVFDALPQLQSGRWVLVGRLDINTSGLLLFTNSGELANKLMHPSSNIDREYLARIRGNVEDGMLENLKRGVELEDGVSKFTDVAESPNNEENHQYKWYYCVVMEGKNREVRRLWESQGLQVARLKRVRYGNVFIPSHVRVGQWIDLNYKELAAVCKLVDMAPPRKKKFQPKVEEQRQRHIKKLRSTRRTNRNKR